MSLSTNDEPRRPLSTHHPYERGVYLLLSGASGFIELGAVIYALRYWNSVPAALIVGLAYQSGSLLRNPIRLGSGICKAALLCGAILAPLSGESVGAFVVAIFLASLGIQGIRDDASHRADVGTLLKRVTRIAGFGAVGLFGAIPLMLASLIALMLSLCVRSEGELRIRVLPTHSGLAGNAMLIHQAHYFAYCYILPAVLLREAEMTPTAAGAAFALGWISYALAPVLLRGAPVVLAVVVGHLGVAIVLAGMAIAGDRVALLLMLWFASGFGGGTVFGIRKLHETWGRRNRTVNLDAWENIGHLVGVGLSLIVVSISSSTTNAFLLASVVAIGTAIVVVRSEIAVNGVTLHDRIHVIS